MIPYLFPKQVQPLAVGSDAVSVCVCVCVCVCVWAHVTMFVCVWLTDKAAGDLT